MCAVFGNEYETQNSLIMVIDAIIISTLNFSNGTGSRIRIRDIYVVKLLIYRPVKSFPIANPSQI